MSFLFNFLTSEYFFHLQVYLVVPNANCGLDIQLSNFGKSFSFINLRDVYQRVKTPFCRKNVYLHFGTIQCSISSPLSTYIIIRNEWNVIYFQLSQIEINCLFTICSIPCETEITGVREDSDWNKLCWMRSKKSSCIPLAKGF